MATFKDLDITINLKELIAEQKEHALSNLESAREVRHFNQNKSSFRKKGLFGYLKLDKAMDLSRLETDYDKELAKYIYRYHISDIDKNLFLKMTGQTDHESTDKKVLKSKTGGQSVRARLIAKLTGGVR